MEAKSKKIPVVIFCGGSSTRMRELTLDRPKPMVEIGGMPILWHIMKIYAHHGFNDFILTLGYLGDYIRNYFKSEYRHLYKDFQITLVETGKSTTTGGRLLRCAKYINSNTFFCTYGDGVSNVDLKKLLKFHNNFSFVGTITAVRVPHKFGIVKKTKDGKMISYKKGHLMDDHVHGGFMVFDKAFLKHLKPGSEVEDSFNLLAKLHKMGVYSHKGFWGAVDTYKDLSVLNNHWDNGRPWKVWRD